MGKYFLFDRNSEPGRWIDEWEGDDEPFINWFPWLKGSYIPKTQVIPDPIKFSLKKQSPWASDHGSHMPSYLEAAAPLFRDDLIAALRAFGVNNFEAYNVAIFDPDNGQTYTNYKAINIIGLIAAADMDKSNATVHPNGLPLGDVDFDGLVIDETKTHGEWFFRLAESTNAIIVHKRVRDYLLEKGFNDLVFYEAENAAF